MEYTIENEALRVTASSRGAELQSIYHKRAAREALWQGDPAYWGGRSPNLFPFVGRLNGGKYLYRGQTYTLPLHGFLPTEETTLVESADNSMSFLLEDNESLLANYPFPFSLFVSYNLDGDTLSETFRLINRGQDAMPFGLGGHPGFNIPFEEGTSFEDYKLAFPSACAPEQVMFDDKVLCTGEAVPYTLDNGVFLPLRHDLFDRDAVVLRNAGDRVRIVSNTTARYIEVCYPDMPQVGFWHAHHTDAPYVCVEPWATLPARANAITDFGTSDDVLHLAAGCEYGNTITIRIAF